MQRLIKILSIICLTVVIFTAIRLGQRLPADTGEYIEKKYAGWSGVLRCWIFSDLQISGSLTGWLNLCAGEFEKQHEGIYIEFQNVSRESLHAPGLHPPDMLIFSADALDMAAETIAVGGYVFVENSDAAGTVISEARSAAAIAMDADIQTEIPESGIDLGLAVSSTTESIEIAEDSFRRFMNGEVGRTIINQGELGKLIALRESGRGPEWKCVVQGEYSWCDQALKMGILAEDERQALCESFRDFLLGEDQQKKLSGIGLFSARGISIYDSFSPYHAMEQQLLNTKPLFIKSEHSPAEFAGLVRKLYQGQISRREAHDYILQTCS